jgi:hypothetical protein
MRYPGSRPVTIFLRHSDPLLRYYQPLTEQPSCQLTYCWFDFRFSRRQVRIWLFWDVAPCSLVEIDRRFRDTYRFHCYDTDGCPADGDGKHPWNIHQFLHGETSQKTFIFWLNRLSYLCDPRLGSWPQCRLLGRCFSLSLSLPPDRSRANTLKHATATSLLSLRRHRWIKHEISRK